MRWGIGIGLAIALGVAGTWWFRDSIGLALLRAYLEPVTGFDETPVPAPPDYARERFWAALPDRDDRADGAPEGVGPDAQASAEADVFFVHPTTFFSNTWWNQPLDDAETNAFTDDVVLPGAASAFNACCRVYAPRFRQATLYAVPVFDETGDGPRALEIAYEDVAAAFEHFLEAFNRDRPFVLAGHSQGSFLAQKLLERRISGTPLVERLVAAYLVGAAVKQTELAENAPDIPVCDGPAKLGCVLSWNTVGPNAARLEDSSDDVCVNPLSWRTDGARAPHSENQGAVFFASADGTTPEDALARAHVEWGATDAQCVDGRLVVRKVRSKEHHPSAVWGENYHVFDYPFFYVNLRANAVERVDRFVAMRAPLPAGERLHAGVWP